MLKREHFDAAAMMAGRLIALKQARGISDAALGRAIGSCHGTVAKWRTQERLPTLKTFLAVADALGMEVVLRERQP